MIKEHCEGKDIGGSLIGNEIVPSISISTSFERERPHESYLNAGDQEELFLNTESVLSNSNSCERKRPHESCLNAGEAEFSRNKKRALESPKSSEVTLLTKPKKNDAPSAGFPQTVRSLTCTGIFDGVPVKYISSSGEELCGRIYGSGYVCGCEKCKFSNVLNADEFERHAGCKTRHPNSRIYFQNGKTVYAVVQKLRTTPESLLFEQISTAAGSPINQKAFSAWKDAFQTSSRKKQG